MFRRVFWVLLYLFIIALLLSAAKGETSDEDGHEQDEHEHEDDEGHELWETASVYSLEANSYTATISTVDGELMTEDGFAFMVFSTSSADDSGLEEAEEIAAAVWEEYADGDEPAVDLDEGETAVPTATIVYSVHLEDDVSSTEVLIEISDDGAYALFLEHGEDEMTFELSSPDGEVIEAAVTEAEGDDEDESTVASGTQWGDAIAASLIISICSLVGIILTSSAQVAKAIDLSHACMVAAGALLTTTFLHIVPEGIEGLESEYDDFHTLGNRMGLALLFGMLFGVAVHATLASGSSHTEHVGHAHGHAHGAVDPTETEPQGKSLHTMIDNAQGRGLFDLRGLDPVCWNVIVGDLVHNFADGVLIGAAFLSCSSSLGWTVTASTILHEVPHEIADFMALINGGMSLCQAYFYNFLSALSAVAGVVIILALEGEITSAETAFLLLFGGGSFIFIALAELIPEGLAPKKEGTTSLGLQFRRVLWFIFGGLLIGIPLIWDEHCDEAHDHDHDH